MCLAVALLSASCDRKTIYDNYEHTPVNGWEKNDTLTFAIDSVEQEGEYVEEIGVRINGLYPFMSLSLVVQQTVLPMGKTYDTTLNCKLIDQNGRAKGSGISCYQYSFPLKAGSVGWRHSARGRPPQHEARDTARSIRHRTEVDTQGIGEKSNAYKIGRTLHRQGAPIE